MSYHLHVDRISKHFGDLKANDEVTLKVARGSVHAILGENGAGKSTLMNVLYGIYQPDGGQILLDGEASYISSPKDALRQGIGMVHQHLMLVEPLTVTENIIMGMDSQRLGLKLAEHQKRIAKLGQSFGFNIDYSTEIWHLSMGQRQQVEILKLLYREVDILILDEPTSVLAPTEIQPFLDILARLKASGKTIILITHKLDEVKAIADEVTVMFHGKTTLSRPIADADEGELARLMVGRDIQTDFQRDASEPGKTMLSVENLCVTDKYGLQALKSLSLKVRAGEILGIAGVDGNGQAELAEAIVGLRDADSGSISIHNQDMTGVSIKDRRHDYKLSYVPEDRHKVGLDLDQSVASNCVLREYWLEPYSRFGLLDRVEVEKYAERLIEDYDIRPADIHRKARLLSGGNQQKIILAREIEAKPEVLVIAQPCKGLDVGAIAFVQKTLLEQRKKGVAILYISTELEHILAICDRIAVMNEGEITGELLPEDATSERIGLLMAGENLDNVGNKQEVSI